MDASQFFLIKKKIASKARIIGVACICLLLLVLVVMMAMYVVVAEVVVEVVVVVVLVVLFGGCSGWSIGYNCGIALDQS